MRKIVGFLAGLYLAFTLEGCAGNQYFMMSRGRQYQCSARLAGEIYQGVVYERTCYRHIGFDKDKNPVFGGEPMVEIISVQNGLKSGELEKRLKE